MAKHQDFRSLKLKLTSQIVEAAKSQNMKLLGDKASELIRVRTRLGYSVKQSGKERSPLKALTSNYVDFRRKYENLSDETRPKKSNLTLTGQMLNSVKTIRTTSNSAFVNVSGRRNEGGTNEEIAGFVSKDRPFLHLSKNEMTQIRLLFEGILKKIFSRS